VTSIVRIHGPEYAEALSAQTDLAQTLIQERRYAEAEKLARETFEIQLRNLGPRHSDVIQALQQLGTAMAYSHRYAEATKLFRDVIEKGGSPTAQGDRWWAWYGFACVAAAANHPDDALQYLREAVTLGYHDADGLVADDDLKNIRSNPQFQQPVAELKAKASIVQAK
jgi:tetratricopeptide (TPR) repeat protein